MAENTQSLRIRWYEDLMACASYVEAQGFHEDAERCREAARKVRPLPLVRQKQEVAS